MTVKLILYIKYLMVMLTPANALIFDKRNVNIVKIKKTKKILFFYELSKHSMYNNYNFDFGNTKILNSENNAYISLNMQHFYIELYEDSVNIRNINTDVIYISNLEKLYKLCNLV